MKKTHLITASKIGSSEREIEWLVSGKLEWRRIDAERLSNLPGLPVEPSVRAAGVAIDVDEGGGWGGRRLTGVLGLDEGRVCDLSPRGYWPSVSNSD